jgi:hypothetical protein
MCRSRQTKQIRLETFEPTEILSLILPPSLLSALGIRPARDPQARACTVLMNNLFTEEKGQLPTSVSAVETTSAGEAGSIPHQLHPPAPHLPLPHHPPHSPSIPSSPSVINQGWKGTSSLEVPVQWTTDAKGCCNRCRSDDGCAGEKQTWFLGFGACARLPPPRT